MKFNLKKLKEKYVSMPEQVKASVWYTICNVINKGIALLSTPIFTRLMTEEEYGTFAIFQSWYSIILIFTSLNIFLGGYSKGLILFKEDKESFTSSQLGLTTLITLIFGVIYIISPAFWTSIFDLPPILMAVMFIELLFMPAVEFWAAKERFDFKYKKYVAVSMVMTILSLGLGVVTVLNTSDKVVARVYSDVFAKALFGIIIFILLFIKGKKFFNKKYWGYALKFNIPLLPHYLSNYVLNQSDRIMISKMIGNVQAAYYSVAYSISMMMTLITSAINNSLMPYIYKEINKIENGCAAEETVAINIRKTTRLLFVLIAALCIITMAFAPEVIYVFAGANYSDAIYVIPPIAASVYFIFCYSMFSNIEYYYQKTTLISIATLVCAALNLVLNYFFIKQFGYYAAGYTTLISYIALSFMHFLFYKRVLRSKLKSVKNLYDMRCMLICAISVLVIMFVMVFTYKIALLRYGIILIIVAIAVWQRKRIISVLKGLKNKQEEEV
jgi:O-antigen/teichoic acid export membrane protein